MNLGIEKIILGFENCEIMEIPAWWIANFYIGDIKTEICRIASNSIQKCVSSSKVIIEIAKGFNEDKKLFDSSDDRHMTSFDRIKKFRDIVSINIVYERQFVDDVPYIEEYLVSYEEENPGNLGSPNRNQQCVFDEEGNLLITIGTGEEIGKWQYGFVKNADKKNSYEMYDIGIPFEPAHKIKNRTFDYPEDNKIVYVTNGKEYPNYKSGYAYRKDGHWIIKPSKYKHDKDDEIKDNEIETWQLNRTCSEKYQKIDESKIDFSKIPVYKPKLENTKKISDELSEIKNNKTNKKED